MNLLIIYYNGIDDFLLKNLINELMENKYDITLCIDSITKNKINKFKDLKSEIKSIQGLKLQEIYKFDLVFCDYKLKNHLNARNKDSKKSVNVSKLLQIMQAPEQNKKVIFSVPSEILCVGGVHYYLGLIYSKEKNIVFAQKHYFQFLQKVNSLVDDIYKPELDKYAGEAYTYILSTYDYNNIQHINPVDFAEIYIDLYEKREMTISSVESRNRIHPIIPKIAERINEKNSELAFKCLQLYAKWDYHYSVKEKDALIERQKEQISELQNSVKNNQNILLETLFKNGCYDEILKIPSSTVVCKDTYYCYLGNIYSQRKNISEAQKYYFLFLNEINSPLYKKNKHPLDKYIGEAYTFILGTYDINNKSHLKPVEFAEIYISLYEKYDMRIASVASRNHAYPILPKLSDKIKANSPVRAFKCLQLYAKYDYIYSVKEKDALIEKQDVTIKKQNEHIKSLQNKALGMSKVKLYRIKQMPHTLVKNIKRVFNNFKNYGFINTAKKCVSKIVSKFCSKQRLLIKELFKNTVLNGFDFYSGLIKKYGDSVKVVGCAPKGTGDYYFCGLYLQAWLKQNDVNNYIFLTLGGAEEKISELFPTMCGHLQKISEEDFKHIRIFSSFVGFKNQKFVYLHHTYPFLQSPSLSLTNGALMGWRGLNMIDFYLWRGCVAPNAEKTMPIFDNNTEKINNIFKDYELDAKKVILLAPYTTGLKDYMIPVTFWEHLAEALVGKGYTVLTNCSGDELPIKYTMPILISYNLIVPFLNKTAGFIGIRSGLCDIISTSMCKKAILHTYKAQYWPDGKSIEYTGLYNMGLSKSVYETEYKEGNETQLLENVLSYITCNMQSKNRLKDGK